MNEELKRSTCAHFPYISTTANTLDGRLDAAIPWETPFTKKIKSPSPKNEIANNEQKWRISKFKNTERRTNSKQKMAKGGLLFTFNILNQV